VLLRSVMEHVKTQNWFAVGIDFIIVVVGVFIGIQVSNWNDLRAERRSEAQYLAALEQDMTESIAEIDDVVRQMQAHDEARQLLFEYSLGEHQELEPVDISRLIHHGIWSFASLELRVTTFDTLRSSGSLGILTDDELVIALQDLAALIEEAEFEEAFEIHALERFTDPFLYENVDMATVLTTPSIATGNVYVPWLEAGTTPLEVPESLNSQQFRNGILFRSGSSNERVDSLQQVREKCIEIGERIDARQEALGAQ